jgi:thiamine pyrophosphate-dependent acetolactate synthase large subunit-like protein
MGATLANGNKPAVLIDGDASTMMHLSDFDTVVRCRMPLLIVVHNDEALGSEYQKLKAHDMDPETSAIPSPDLGASRAPTAPAARSPAPSTKYEKASRSGWRSPAR